jgi:hypothetical protein
VDEYTTKVLKLKDCFRKGLRAEGVVANAPILEGMNVLILKHYVMGFQKEIRQQV